LTEISRLENGGFSIVCEKCHVVDVTVGDVSVVSTSGFMFTVGLDLNHLMCSGDVLGNVYFWSEALSNVGKKISGTVILAVPMGLVRSLLLLKTTRGVERGGEFPHFSTKRHSL